jgi:hypothetical protein
MPGSRTFDDPGIFEVLPLVNQIRGRVKAGMWRQSYRRTAGLSTDPVARGSLRATMTFDVPCRVEDDRRREGWLIGKGTIARCPPMRGVFP